MKVGDIVAETEWRPSASHASAAPVISVLLPTFRRGASGLFLKAVRSVLDQDFRDLELIIVDDASTDGTADQIVRIMEEDDRVHCLTHPRNVGLPAISEYEAYGRARGQYFAFAFDDDEFHPEALGRLLEAARAARAPFVHGYVEIFGRDPRSDRPRKIGDFGRDPTPQVLLRSNNYLANNSVLVHRRVLEEVGLYDPHVCIARLCDWDLMRRIADRFELLAVDVAVGRQLGPSTTDSLGHTYQMEPWLAVEWMNRDRDESLRPSAFAEYDVLAVPPDLSPEARVEIAELAEGFRSKSWYVRPPAPAPDRPAPPLAPDGHILVVTASYDASTTLYFDHLPQPYASRVRVIHFGPWTSGMPDEMVGASAVVFVRAAYHFVPWIEMARQMGVPHYYFLDDNLVVLAEHPAYRQDYAFYTNDNLREMLASFDGVLLSTKALVDHFATHRLHSNLVHYPPVARAPRIEVSAPAGRPDALRVAYFGGSHRGGPFKEEVLPALRDLAEIRPVELVAFGVDLVKEDVGRLEVTSVPMERSYGLAVARLRAYAPQVLVHPNSHTANNPFKTAHVLINATIAGAAAVVSDEPPYQALAGTGAAELCAHDRRSWFEALSRLADSPAERARLVAGAEEHCRSHYSGRDNAAALDRIFERHRSPGLLTRDSRYRKALAVFKAQGPLSTPGSATLDGTVRVPVWGVMSYPIRCVTDSVERLVTVVGSFQGGLSGTVTVEIVEPRTGKVLRTSSATLDNLWDWGRFTFDFEPLPNVKGRVLILRFVAATDRQLALFETSRHCHSLRRRLLRKLRRDHRGRDLYCALT